MTRRVKWARLSEIDHRTKVGSKAWYRRHPIRVRKLSAWRYLHKLGNHTQVSIQGKLRGRRPSSRMTVRQMIDSARALKGV